MMRKISTRRNRMNRDELSGLEEIPNVGPAIAADLRRLGITLPSELPGRDPYEMYDDLCRITGKRHDPCLLDTSADLGATVFRHLGIDLDAQWIGPQGRP